MKNSPVESLLRCPVEWFSGAACCIAATVILYEPSEFLLTTNISKILAIALFIVGTRRFFQGLYILRYRRNLKRLPYYAMSSDELLISNKKLFLGRGFEWLPRHTQRLYDLKQRNGERYLKPSRLYQWARAYELKHEGGANKLVPLLSSQSIFNPVRPLPPVGGNPAIHGVEMNEKNIYLNLSERIGHMICQHFSGQKIKKDFGLSRILRVINNH